MITFNPLDPAGNPMPATIDRGFRGIMSATLVLETIVILLALPVASTSGVGTAGIVAILLLACAHVAMCVAVRRSWFLPVVLVLQLLTIAGWALLMALGVMGIIFGAVWVAIIWFRVELGRRWAAGSLPIQQQQSE